MWPSPRASEPVVRRTARPSSAGSTTVVGAELAASSRCSGCLATATTVPAWVKRRRAAMVSRPRVPAPSTTTVSSTPPATGGQGAVHGAGGRLDHHGGLVGHVVGHGVELARVGDHERRPAAAGVAAEAGLQARLEVAEGDALAVAEVAPLRRPGRPGRCPGRRSRAPARARPGRCRRCRRGRPPPRGRGRTGTTRSARSSATRCRRWWPGRCRRCPARRGRMRTQSGPGRSGGSTSRRRSGPTWAPAPGITRPAATRGRVAGDVALEQQRLHRRTHQRVGQAAVRAAAFADRQQHAGAPGAFVQCSTSQPRLRARAARRVSGLTATGKPTASSIGRSLVESA